MLVAMFSKFTRQQFMRHRVNVLIAFLMFCCSNKTLKKQAENSSIFDAEDAKKEISKENRVIDTAEIKTLRLEKTYRFENYKVPIFKGNLAEPNFTGNPFASDREYVDFVKNGCEENSINFAGHYTIIERSCGVECSHVFLVDRKDGKIFTDTKPNDGRYGYQFRKDSELLIANSKLFIDDKFEHFIEHWCKPEFYKWNKNNFTLLK